MRATKYLTALFLATLTVSSLQSYAWYPIDNYTLRFLIGAALMLIFLMLISLLFRK